MPLSNAGAANRRSSVNTAANGNSFNLSLPEVFSDSREHGYRGPTRHVRFARATTNGGGSMAKSDDGVRCVVAGRECECSTCSLRREAMSIPSVLPPPLPLPLPPQSTGTRRMTDVSASARSTPDPPHVGRLWLWLCLGEGLGVTGVVGQPERPQVRDGQGRTPDRGLAQHVGRERAEGRQLEHRRRVVPWRYVATARIRGFAVGTLGSSRERGGEAFSNKILTSARNGELVMWDLNKNGSSKYGE